MRIGQTSIIVFLSKLLASAIGFLATIYFARILGAEIIGIYSVVIALVGWLALFGTIGTTQAVTKRLSEGNDQGAFQVAGIVLISIFAIGLTIGLILGRPLVESYVSGFEEYVAVSVVWFLIALTIAQLAYSMVRAFLTGQHKVHIDGFMEPSVIGVRSLIQVGLVVLGYNLLGMVVGNLLGTAIVAVLGMHFVSFTPRKPRSKHIRSLFDYAKFSWLGGLKSRAFNDVDIVILGALVPSSLVGVYAVVWSLSTFLRVFGIAISRSMFPEISKISSQERLETAVPYVEDTLAFAGLIAIPGLVGGILLGDRLLRIYGSEFTQGTEVLWLLLSSIVLYSFFHQLLNTLNAINRPDQAFRVNAIFVLTNVILNLILITQLGWVGAAIASAISVGIGLAISYTIVASLLPLTLPIRAIGKQIVAALGMGFGIVGAEYLIETQTAFTHNVVIVLALVLLGAATYGLFLLTISARVRATIVRNLPIDPPFVTRFLK